MKLPPTITAIILCVSVLHANGLRVDIDFLSAGRTDMYTPRWNNWAPSSAATVSSTWNGITVTFRNAGTSGITPTTGQRPNPTPLPLPSAAISAATSVIFWPTVRAVTGRSPAAWSRTPRPMRDTVKS